MVLPIPEIFDNRYLTSSSPKRRPIPKKILAFFWLMKSSAPKVVYRLRMINIRLSHFICGRRSSMRRVRPLQSNTSNVVTHRKFGVLNGTSTSIPAPAVPSNKPKRNAMSPNILPNCSPTRNESRFVLTIRLYEHQK